ncbi:MAG: hypothetical protein M1821_003417 [Bathelium mastoideum]|nr:MAG: hypothetical protein M1821_003417 [Bathelium mastoideum]
MTAKEIDRWRLEIWRIFQTAFRLVVELLKGFPAECPDFRKGFHFSVLPMKVQNRIIGYVMPTLQNFGLMVKDYWPMVTARPTTFSLEDKDGRRRYATYAVSRISSSKTPPELVPFLTSKVHRGYLQGVQYAKGIVFDGSPESAMHDRMGKLDFITKMAIDYRLKEIPSLNASLSNTGTSPRSWQKLSNILVHDCTGLKHLTVIVHRSFWDKIKWNVNGPDHYATATQLIRLPKRSFKETSMPADDDEDHPCSFLEKIGRLSKQVHLDVKIDQANTDDKQYFNMAVNLRLRHGMCLRPPLAEKKEGCRCEVKVLWNSCAWEPPEAR